LSNSASDHRDDAAVRLSDAVAALFGAVTELNVPMFPSTFPVVRSFVAHHGAAFAAQRNRIPETATMIRKNGFDAAPVAALASGALDTERPAAQS
jgi:hypothetical protein